METECYLLCVIMTSNQVNAESIQYYCFLNSVLLYVTTVFCEKESTVILPHI